MFARSFYKGIIVTTLLFVFVFQVNAEQAEQADQAEAARDLLLVDVSWLQQNLDEPNIVILDARSPAEFQQGHIAGAVNFPATYTYQSALKKRVVLQHDFEVMLGSLGINNDSHVIIYGSALYQNAARVFWALELYGHRQLSLLNGAFPAWQAAGLPVDTRTPQRSRVSYRAAIHPGKMATRLQTLLAIDNPRIALIDAREPVEYQGVKSRAIRFGHIPTALNIAKRNNLEVRQGMYYFKSEAALAELYADINNHVKTILYCQSGSESAISYLALRLLGKNVSLYDGAWQEWGNTPDLPITSSVP